MPSITQGARPITGVYVRGRLATGLYVGQQAIWPTEILGSSNLGTGRFGFGGRGLLAGTGNNLHVAPRTFTFSGRPLQSAISRALRVDMARGATLLTGRSAGIAASAEPPLHAGALAVGASPLSVISGHVIPAITGSLHFTGQPLPKVSGNEVAAYLSPGTLQFAAVNVAVAASVARAIGAGGFTFAGTAPSVGTGSALLATLAPSALALTGSMPSIGAATEVSIGADAMAFTGAVLYPPAHVVVNVTPSALSMWGHYTEVDTSPFALRSVGTRLTTTPAVLQSTPENVMLPIQAKVGDIAFIARPGPKSTDESVPTGATVLEDQQLTLYQKALTVGDVVAGYVVANVSATRTFAVEVFHGADATLDVLGTYTTTTSPPAANFSATANIAGIATTRQDSIPFAALAANNMSNAKPVPTSPWFAQVWSSGITLLTESPVPASPGTIGDITCAYGTQSSSGSSTASAVMLAVRPLYVNATLDMGAGAVDMAGALATTPFSDPNVGLSIHPGTIAFWPAQLVGNQDTPQVLRVGQNVVYNSYAGPEKVTQLPLPAGTQAGDYMFVNVGAVSYDPNNPPAVPRDSQKFVSLGATAWMVLAYWVPIVQHDVNLGYIEIDARVSANFTYIVYRNAARELQAIGTLGDVLATASGGNATVVAPGVDVPNASGAAIIAFATTDSTSSDFVDYGGIGATGWSGPYAVNALTSSGGGLRAGLLAQDPQIARRVADTTVTYGPASGVQVAMDARMFVIAPAVVNAVMAMTPADYRLKPSALVIQSVAAGGDIQIGILPGTLALAYKGLTVTTESHPDSLQDVLAGSIAFTGASLDLVTSSISLQMGAGALGIGYAALQVATTSWRTPPAPTLAMTYNAFSIPANTTQPLQATLPAGTAAGDSVVCSVYTNDRNTTTVTPPAGATSIYPSTSNPAVVSTQSDDHYTATQFAVVVSATDVTNGYIGGFSATNASATKASAGGCYSVRVTAPYEYSSGAANAWLEFRQDQPKSGSAGTATASADNAVALSIAGAGQLGYLFVPANDYTYFGGGSTFDSATQQQTGMSAWTKEGVAAGSFTTSLSYTPGGGAISSYDTALLSLVPLVPGPFIAIHGELPDAIPVSAGFSGDVLTANELGATGTVGLTSDAGWVTVGTPVDNGDGSSTWPITGDAPSAGSLPVTFTATNGDQTSKLTHTFVANDNVGLVTLPDAMSFTGAQFAVMTLTGTFVDVAHGTVAFVGAQLAATGAASVALDIGAGALAITGQALAENVGAAASVPGVVQIAVTPGNQAANTSELITFASAPTTGRKIVVAAYSGSGTPSVAGFDLIASLTPNSKQLYWFAKVSDGTEQNITVAYGASNASHGCAAVELDANATLGDAYATNITLAATANSIGPSSTPTQQGTPLLFGFFDGPSDATPWTWPAGWSGVGPDDGGSGFPYRGSVMGAGPAASSAFTITVTRPSTRGNNTTFYWSNLWVYP